MIKAFEIYRTIETTLSAQSKQICDQLISRTIFISFDVNRHIDIK